MTTIFGVFTLAILRLLIPVAILIFMGERIQRQSRSKKAPGISN